MKAKLSVLLARNIDRLVRHYKAKKEKNSLNIHPEYYFGYALALSKQRSYSQAIKIFKQLRETAPENISYIIGLANAYIASNKKSAVQTGLNLLADSFKNRNYNLVFTVNYAYALQKTGYIKKSIQVLEDYNKDNLKHPAAYKLLSTVLGKNKQLVKAHIAQATYYYLQGMLTAAIEQLEIARKITPDKDYYTLSRINAKKKAYKEEKELYTMEEI